MKKAIILMTLAALTGTAFGQADRHLLRDGNRAYNKEKYDQAELHYRRALERDTADFRGQYNLGNALYRQKHYDEAISHYDQALAIQGIDKQKRSRTLHNRGNSMVKAGLENEQQGMQYFQQAVDSYQESLKLDPKNEDTRYNLAYARRLLQQAQQQQQQQGGGQNNQDNQDQQQNQQQQSQQQQNQQQNQQQQNQQNQQQDQQPKQQQGQQSQAKPDQKKQDAERMLEAVKNNERQTLRDLDRSEIKAKAKHTDKDW